MALHHEIVSEGSRITQEQMRSICGQKLRYPKTARGQVPCGKNTKMCPPEPKPKCGRKK